MTKKHFEQFARAIDAQRRVTICADPHGQAVRLRTLQDVAEQFATIASQDNPRFDRSRFQEACGL